jgi:hypothetical protein
MKKKRIEQFQVYIPHATRVRMLKNQEEERYDKGQRINAEAGFRA